MPRKPRREPRSPILPPGKKALAALDAGRPGFATPEVVVAELVVLPQQTEEDRKRDEVVRLLEEGVALAAIAASTGLKQREINRILDSPLGGVAFEKGTRARRRWLQDDLLTGAMKGVAAMNEIAGDSEAGENARLRAAEGMLDRAGMGAPKEAGVQVLTQVNVDTESFRDRLARTIAEERARRGEA